MGNKSSFVNNLKIFILLGSHIQRHSSLNKVHYFLLLKWYPTSRDFSHSESKYIDSVKFFGCFVWSGSAFSQRKVEGSFLGYEYPL